MTQEGNINCEVIVLFSDLVIKSVYTVEALTDQPLRKVH
jgi:hypothetical protein